MSSAEEARRKAVALAAKKRKSKKLGDDEGDSRDDETYRPGGGKKKKSVPVPKEVKVVSEERKNIESKISDLEKKANISGSSLNPGSKSNENRNLDKNFKDHNNSL